MPISLIKSKVYSLALMFMYMSQALINKYIAIRDYNLI